MFVSTFQTALLSLLFLSFLDETVKNSQTWLIAVLTRVNSESTQCHSFLSAEVNGCDCLPDRCYGKSALSFLDSTWSGNLQLLAFLATAAAKKEALAWMQKICCDLHLEFKTE